VALRSQRPRDHERSSEIGAACARVPAAGSRLGRGERSDTDQGGRGLRGFAAPPEGHPAVVEGTHEALPPLRDLVGRGRPVWPTDR